MTDLSSKVAYLRGLSDGLELDTTSKEGRLIAELLGIVGEMADSIASLASGQEELETYVDVLDTDLQDLEDEVFGDDETELEDAAARALPYGEPLGSAGLIADCYVCPNCGGMVSRELAEDDPTVETSASEGTILTRLVCPECHTVFHSTEPGTATYIDSEDELTDLAHQAKE